MLKAKNKAKSDMVIEARQMQRAGKDQSEEVSKNRGESTQNKACKESLAGTAPSGGDVLK